MQPTAWTADQQHGDLVQNFQAKNANYDVMSVDVIWTAEFAAKGWLQPLTGKTAIDTAAMLPATVKNHGEREVDFQMTTASATRVATPDPHARAKAKTRRQWASARTYLSAGIIVVWCLLPAYWMVVTAFREVGFTYDSTPFFTQSPCFWRSPVSRRWPRQ